MILNGYGQIIRKIWLDLPSHYPDIVLDELVIMPNHIHFIIANINRCRGGVSPPENVHAPIGAGRETRPLQSIDRPALGQIVGYFKYHTTKHINILRLSLANPVWQRSFYDHIIRNEKSYWEIREYIRNNPANWATDEMYPPKADCYLYQNFIASSSKF